MRCFKYVLGYALVASAFGLGGAPALADDASDALKKCDTLASHPSDPNRYATGVADEQFAPGAAIEACEAAQKLNPDNPRIWFELGRAYWIGRRDTQAFSAFIQAEKRDYAPAMKFIGDAYLTGRGLPSGEQRDAQTALHWYQKSAAGHFSDADEAAEHIINDIEKKELDPRIFQNQRFITLIYNNNKPTGIEFDRLSLYSLAFMNTIGGTEPFFVNGQTCIPQILSSAMANLTAHIAHLGVEMKIMTSPFGDTYISTKEFVTLSDQGHRDAISLFNRYGCDGDVPHQIIQNMNAMFDPNSRKQPSNDPAPDTSAAPPQSQDRPLRKPASFDCAKASMGSDFVICAYADLLDAEARLEDAYNAAKAARGTAVRSEQIDWMKSYGPDCGVPFRGRPSSALIRKSRDCVFSAMEKRIGELQNEQ